MYKSILHFIKYNNAAIIILAFLFLAGTAVLAAEPARDALGRPVSEVRGVDNAALLSADLDKFDMDYKITGIEEDDKYYYVHYTFMDLMVKENVWQYVWQVKRRRISRSLKSDLGKYLADQFKEEYDYRLSQLRVFQEEARVRDPEKRQLVEGYSGLIGQTLDIAEKVFPGYVSESISEVPTPDFDNISLNNPSANPADDLTQVYEDYVSTHSMNALLDNESEKSDLLPDEAKDDTSSAFITATGTSDQISEPEVEIVDPDIATSS